MGGSFPFDLIPLLPQFVRDYYDLDELYVADFQGMLMWAVRQFGDWYLGPLLGPQFADAVQSSFNVVWGPSEVPDSWWV